MGRKFLSFLGTTKYVPANYSFQAQKVDNVTFVQEALVQIFCKDWNKDDKICIFCTKDAQDKNWEDKDKSEKANFDKGLYSRLLSLNLRPNIEKVDIPEGKTEEEILAIFERVFNALKENDSITFDITHSFRSLPMLNLVVLNYAKFLKNIEIEGIYYGAFEVLGHPGGVEKSIPLEKRNAPIFDLTPYAELLEWSWAVSDFVKYGQTLRLKELVEEKTRPVLAETKGKNASAKDLKTLAEKLNELANNILCNRGYGIMKQNNFNALIDNIQRTELIPPFKPLLEKIKTKTRDFRTDDVKNGFIAAKWCYEHGLIPQGITILQETIISLFCKGNKLNIRDKRDREFISACLNVGDKPQIRLRDILEERKKEAEKIINTIPKEIPKLFRDLTGARNDINHGGFNKDARKYQKFYQQLNKFLQEAEKLF